MTIADRIADDVAGILKLADVRERLTSLGLEPIANGRIRTGEIIVSESKQWEAVVQAAKLPRE